MAWHNQLTGLHPTLQIVGNKAKGRISKRVFQENKARQIFRKTNISYPLIRTHPFWDSTFCLITDEICCYTNTFSLDQISNCTPDLIVFLRRSSENITVITRLHTLHKKWGFPLRISSVNVTKSLMENFIFMQW